MVLMGFVGLRPEHGAEVLAGRIMHLRHEQAFRIGDRRRSLGDLAAAVMAGPLATPLPW